MKKSKLLFLLLFTINSSLLARPRVAVVMVIDQFAHHYLKKLRPHFKEGFAELLDNGVVYDRANHPHSMPATATGHTALSTGCQAKDHGIVGNYWIDANGNKVTSDDDSPENAAVYSPDGTYNIGRSSRNNMVDGLSDQIMLNANNKTHRVFALSMKSRAAICSANKMGKAIWWDEKVGSFTTSKAYFDAFPAWLAAFNHKHAQKKPPLMQWELAYPVESKAYRFRDIHNDDFTAHKHHIADNILTIDAPIKKSEKFERFSRTPQANELLFELARTCIDEHLTADKDDLLVVWVSLSSLDKLAHQMGPDHISSIDMLYHLDRQIGNFMAYAQKKIGDDKVLFALTADHGSMSIPELLAKRGIPARRIMVQNLIARMNRIAEQKYGIAKLVRSFKAPQFYLDQKKLTQLDDEAYHALISDLKHLLKKERGIKKVWTPQELLARDPRPFSRVSFYKNQLYEGRSGQLICYVHPYCQLTRHSTGTGHRTPYDYDTHVPLVLYQKNVLGKKRMHKKVWTQQFANTMARLLEVPQPSASDFKLLPGIS